MNLEKKLEQAIIAIQANQKKEARTLLTEIVKADEDQLEAWLWLSQVVDSLEERTICLENVLTLNPDNEFAQAELAKVKSEQEKVFVPTYVQGEEKPLPAVVTVPEAVTTPVTSEYPYKDEFDNEWLCPYCLAPTRPKDRTCPSCRRSLIITVRVKPERTAELWRGILLQFAVVIFLIAFGTGSFNVIIKLNGIPNPVPFLPLYFGLPIDQPEDLSQMVLEVFPIWFFLALAAAVLYSSGLLILLYLRVPYGHFLYMVNASIMLVLSTINLYFFFYSTPILTACVIGLSLGATQLVVAMTLWGDFTFKEGRLRLKIDRDAKTHPALFLSARKYNRLGMWGLSIIHLRRAVAQHQRNSSYYATLAVAYMNVKRYDLADKTLGKAEKLGNTTQIWQLRKQLDSLIKSETVR